MNSKHTYKPEDYNFCVIIPTYNNCKTLQRVIDNTLKITQNILVVNDGSTDKTSDILKNYSNLKQLHHETNKGKGTALRNGFKFAVELGYAYAITIDSDGQHFPEDIPVFLERLSHKNNDEEVLFIGARNMSQSSVPKKSSFGNKFSNFWFWVETGIKLQDTQSGYRLYPLNVLKNISFYTNKFEFEIEVIVKAAWRGVTVENVPVKVLYDESERVSHFRPFKDFTRISILNTWLVIVTFLYIKPRDFFRSLKKKGIKKFLIENVLVTKDSNSKKVISIALGVFLAFSPFWGFQGLLAIGLSVLLRLNKAITFLFSNVSIPPLIPFVVLASVKTGEFLLGEKVDFDFNNFENLKLVTHLKVYAIGSLCFAFFAALLTGLLSFVFLTVTKTKHNE